jgi:hypothetical protein
MTTRERERRRLVARNRRTKAEIEQIFRDVAYYNANYLPPGEPPIEADPDGEMARWSVELDRMLVELGEPVT